MSLLSRNCHTVTSEIFIKSNLTVKINNCNNTKIIDTEINQIKV